MTAPSAALQVFVDIEEGGVRKGKIELLVDIIERTLRRRGVALMDAQRDRLHSITDLEVLKRMVDKVPAVKSAAALFPRRRTSSSDRAA